MRQGQQWYRRYPHAFIDGVQGMGPEMIGAYAVLIELIYARDGNTVRDDRHLAGVLGCSKRLAKSLTDKLVAKGKIVVSEDGVLSNPRAAHELQHKEETSEKRADAGRKSGAARRGVSKSVRDKVLKRKEVEP